ncbi:MAG TPA: hypothetical protein VGN72_03140 [Tepidisphaeraceae bacterium]|jgi:hypothetical protein|nr:hypothetical protein [Tepidisphaeraceae bacterium]
MAGQNPSRQCRTFRHTGLTAGLIALSLLTEAQSVMAEMKLSVDAGVPLGLYTPQQPAKLNVRIEPDPTAPTWSGRLLITRADLLTEEQVVEELPVEITGGQPAHVEYAPSLANGMYRLDMALMAKPSTSGDVAPLATARQFIGHAPARWARDLPDDWPLNTHLSADLPPLQGFKTYRVFTHWATNNPQRGEYIWTKLDGQFETIKRIGGRMTLADDSAPAWSVSPERAVPIKWIKGGIANPPDDMNDYRTYVRALLDRYDDGTNTLAAVETWNEANTSDRWNGTPQQLVEMARILREERERSPGKPRIIGIAVSAGDHKKYVNAQVEAGILNQVDVVSGHWYEEMHSYDADGAINSLVKHVDLLRQPMEAPPDVGRG